VHYAAYLDELAKHEARERSGRRKPDPPDDEPRLDL